MRLTASILGIAGLSLLHGCAPSPKPTPPATLTPSPSATWPWPTSTKTSPFSGVTKWRAVTSDKTTLELYRFDFFANRKLRFALYDQDQDDDQPFDNASDYFAHGLGWVTNHLNETGRGEVVLAWNGLFFAFLPKRGNATQIATHIGPVVIDGKAHYNVGQHRWTFAVSYDTKGHPSFKVLFKPGQSDLSKFTYAVDGAQCLIHDGMPLHLAMPSDPAVVRTRGGVLSTDHDVGSIPVVDDIKSSRTSIGWSKDSRYLYVLIVGEPDTETGSIEAFRKHLPQQGGWNLLDLQTFWQKLGVWGAINSDGGMETQRTFLQPDRTYNLLRPQLNGPGREMTLDKNCSNAPAGGTLMTFYVSERGSKR